MDADYNDEKAKNTFFSFQRQKNAIFRLALSRDTLSHNLSRHLETLKRTKRVILPLLSLTTTINSSPQWLQEKSLCCSFFTPPRVWVGGCASRLFLIFIVIIIFFSSSQLLEKKINRESNVLANAVNVALIGNTMSARRGPTHAKYLGVLSSSSSLNNSFNCVS